MEMSEELERMREKTLERADTNRDMKIDLQVHLSLHLSIYWVPQKLEQIYTVIAYICIRKMA